MKKSLITALMVVATVSAFSQKKSVVKDSLFMISTIHTDKNGNDMGKLNGRVDYMYSINTGTREYKYDGFTNDKGPVAYANEVNGVLYSNYPFVFVISDKYMKIYNGDNLIATQAINTKPKTKKIKGKQIKDNYGTIVF